MKRVVILAVAAAATTLSVSAPAPAQPRGALPPPGNYDQFCRNVSTYGFGPDRTMTAECRDRDGRWRQTSLRFAGCDRVEVRDGALSCRPGRDYDPPPPGPGFGPPPYDRDRDHDRDRGRPSLTLYGRPNFDGRPFFTDHEITNLPREFNDRAMSVRIEGRRPWMLCTDSDFRGRCQVIDHDVRDLREIGMAGQVSSMRPYR